jgi:hypothetical protein
MSSSASNNVDNDASLMQLESQESEIGETNMEEDDGDSLEVHPPASERGTLAGISSIPNPHQAMGTINNHEGQQTQEGLPPRRPLHRLHQNNFHNLIHNYGVENTSRTHLPSRLDTSRPSDNNAG